MKKLTKWGLTLAVGGSMLAATSANAIIIIGNHDDAVGAPTPSFNGSAIDTDQSKGIQFTTTVAYELTSLALALQNLNATGSADDDEHSITVRAGDLDGAVVGTFDQVTPDVNAQFGAATTFGFTSSAPIILAVGTYTIRLDAGNNSFNWSAADADADPGDSFFGIEPTGPATFDAYRLSNSTVNGGAISNSSVYNSFRLEGEIVNDVPVPGAALLMGMGLFMVRRKVKA